MWAVPGNPGDLVYNMGPTDTNNTELILPLVNPPANLFG